MSSGTVYLRPSRLVYVRATGPYENSVLRAWERLLGWLDKHGLQSPIGRGYGMMRDNPNVTAPENCRYDACVDLHPFFEERAIRELSAQTLPGGAYVRMRKTGAYEALREDILGFYKGFEAANGLRFDQRRPLITIYLDEPRRFRADDLRADICVPVSSCPTRISDDDGRAAA